MFAENLEHRQGQELISWPETVQISSVKILAAHHNKHPHSQTQEEQWRQQR